MSIFYSDLNNCYIDAKVFVIASSEQEARELIVKEIEVQGFEAKIDEIELSSYNPDNGVLFLYNN